MVVSELGGSSINLLARVRIERAAYERQPFFATLELCNLALDEAGIQIPFPHVQLFVDDVDEKVWSSAENLRAVGEP